jgi:hypothetical protein
MVLNKYFRNTRHPNVLKFVLIRHIWRIVI